MGTIAVSVHLEDLSPAETFYVDVNNTSGVEDGTMVNPFNTIGEAIALVSIGRGDTVIVLPGFYFENIVLKDNLSLIGRDGSFHTFISDAGGGTVVTLAADSALRGFSVGDGSASAVDVPAGIVAEVTNCVLYNSDIGLSAGADATLAFVNNTVDGNTSFGLHGASGATFDVFKNNVLTVNGTGVFSDATAIVDGGYNLFFGNGMDYDGPAADMTDFTEDPLYVDPGDLNFHLRALSPARDAGDPDPAFNDLDGTRNDLGADGGPQGVQDLLAPLCVAMVAPMSGDPPLTVTFDGSASTDEWGIASYCWDLDSMDGDGDCDIAGPIAEHTYAIRRMYIATLTVTDNNGLQSKCTVEIEVGSNHPPDPVELLFPADQATLDRTSTALVWTDSVDPDGDVVTYTVEVDTVNTFDSPDKILLEGLTDNVVSVTGLQSTNYFWRVTPVDAFGATPAPIDIEERRFTFGSLTDPAVTEGIWVEVSKNEDGQGISAAGVEATPTNASGTPTGDDPFQLNLLQGKMYSVTTTPSGNFTVTVSATGRLSQTTDVFFIGARELKSLDIRLILIGVDSDGDGLLDTDEDANNNGIVDSGETDPNVRDTDGDGFADGLEIQDGTDPTDAADNSPRTDVYVNFQYTGVEWGTVQKPVTSLGLAVPLAGAATTIHFQTSGDGPAIAIDEPGKTLILSAEGGRVRLGIAARSRSGLDGIDSGAEASEAPSSTHSVGEPDGNGSDSGTGKLTAEAVRVILDKLIYEPVLPYSRADETAYIAAVDARLSLRIRADDVIDIRSLWADITGYGAETPDIAWTSADGASAGDLWVHFTSENGWAYDGLIEALGGGLTLSGASVASDYAHFLIESEVAASNRDMDSGEIVWQPDTGQDTGRITVIAGAPGRPELESASGPIYTLRPESVYDEPQRVWLPLPAGADAGTIGVFYYHPNGDDSGWYPAENVLGWLVPDSALTLEVDGMKYLGLLVRHAAILHLGSPTGAPQ